ncbi:hypothetical protein EKG37_07800 [Robertmurraya yapensis]|uniref:YwpF-like family protein n=1 Tax=Bacillus yapensis TaxID=2492960 RepID=A0A3S0II06_9BACI|nr:YwpF-like family protein [Bacillus yapensis]RTR32957.1 hypothetical protein EKG37_07800 [Bacillus yapensis]TKS96780.1 hypothetical protein FAR12_07800 [Bacillus yapensis]
MKTFKLISLQIVKQDEWLDIPLEDGLIINKEDENNTWLMECYTDKSFYDLFYECIDQEKELLVQVVITKKENDPAPFKVKARSLQTFENHISVLLEGTLKRAKNHYAELLLGDLLEKGLTGDELLDEFKSKMITRPKLTTKEIE